MRTTQDYWEREIDEDSAEGRGQHVLPEVMVVSVWPPVKQNNTYDVKIDEEKHGPAAGDRRGQRGLLEGVW